MLVVCNYLNMVIEIINIILCQYYFYNEKPKPKRENILVVCSDVLILTIIDKFSLSNVLSLFIYTILLLFCSLEFKRNLKETILGYIISIVMVSLLQLLVCIPWGLVPLNFLQDDELALIVNILVLIFLFLMKNIFIKIFCIIRIGNRWVLQVCAILLFFLLVNITHIKQKFELTIEQILWAIILGGIIIWLIFQWQKEREQLHIKEMENRMHELYDDSFAELIQSIREKQHDFYNHLQTIKSQHYTIHTYDELVAEQKQYCDQLITDNKYYNLLNCKSPVLTGFLYGKFLEAEKENIEIDYFVSVMRNTYDVPEYILIEMVGIIWDNAVEYVSGTDLKKVNIEIRETEECFMAKVENPIQSISYDEILEFFKKGVTKKAHHQGLGLSKIVKYKEQYGFQLIVEKKNINNTAWLSIRINVEHNRHR